MAAPLVLTKRGWDSVAPKPVASTTAPKSPVLPKVPPEEMAGAGSHIHCSARAQFGRPTPPQEHLAPGWRCVTSLRAEPR